MRRRRQTFAKLGPNHGATLILRAQNRALHGETVRDAADASSPFSVRVRPAMPAARTHTQAPTVPGDDGRLAGGAFER